MSLDRRYLEKHGAQWRVQMKVPLSLRAVVGKAKLVRSLKTDNLALANKMRWSVVAEFKKVLEAAEKGLTMKGNALLEEALKFRREWEIGKDDPLAFADFDEEGPVADSHQVLSGFASDRAIEIAETIGPEEASFYHGIATGELTPLEMMVGTWLEESGCKPRQKLDYARAVSKLSVYMANNKKSASIESVNKRFAGAYVSSLVAEKVHPKTINKDVSALSSYWRWLEKKDFASANVWSRQSVPKLRTPKGFQKRAYSDKELLILLLAPGPAFLKDAIFIACLSGLRIEEIARLRVKDVSSNSCFDIGRAKTGAGERLVPIHSQLEEIVQRRVTSKHADDYLFHELPTPDANSAMERSQKISKAFTSFRRKLKVDDVPEGARQSRIDFHSLRRWFVYTAGQALSQGATGFTPWTIAQLVGHERESLDLSMTMGRYHGDDNVDELRLCVQAVNLPVKI